VQSPPVGSQISQVPDVPQTSPAQQSESWPQPPPMAEHASHVPLDVSHVRPVQQSDGRLHELPDERHAVHVPLTQYAPTQHWGPPGPPPQLEPLDWQVGLHSLWLVHTVPEQQSPSTPQPLVVTQAPHAP
jgi:hypothetical protein